jgi:osmoprotectant transport system ATP-binding protein
LKGGAYLIRFEEVTKRFDDFIAVDNLNINLNAGEIVVLIGPSGCGKTTTLRMINRLVEPTEGKIYINGTDSSKIDPVELRRSIGYVIQQIALFPHMSIAQNIGLVPYLKNWPEAKRKQRVEELLELVGMPASQFYHRYPHELSGGQQQRIGVARALAADPEIILMDEPFGAVDPITRDILQEELTKLQDELHKTIIFVTHDIDEALKLADRIAVMKEGKVLQYDTPEQLLRNPAHGYVEEFIGRDRLLQRPELIMVKDIMIKDPVTTSPERTLTQALEKMRQHKVDSLMVIDRSGDFIGLVTARDVHRNLDNAEKVSEIMKTGVRHVSENAKVNQVLSIMAKEQVGYVPVVDLHNHLTGLVTRSSLVNVLGQPFNSRNGKGV